MHQSGVHMKQATACIVLSQASTYPILSFCHEHIEGEQCGSSQQHKDEVHNAPFILDFLLHPLYSSFAVYLQFLFRFVRFVCAATHFQQNVIPTD